MGTVSCCSRIPCCKVCLSCRCWSCCMDTYLHVYVRSIHIQDDAMRDADANFAGTGDIYCELSWGDWRQITTVSDNEKGGVSETEPVILENAKPDDPKANNTLMITVWDHDQTSGDDFVCAAAVSACHPKHPNMPLYYGQNLGEQEYELVKGRDGKSGAKVGTITIDQVHFIQQKLQPYRGCKMQCCCCDENAPVCCCIETAKSLSYRAQQENKHLLENQQKANIEHKKSGDDAQ